MTDRAHTLTDKELEKEETKFHVWPNLPVVLSKDLDEDIELTNIESFKLYFRKKEMNGG